MKYCNTCETEKDESMFHKRAASSDGFCAKCKTCQKVYDKLRNKQDHRKEARAIYAQTEEGKLAGNKAKSEYRKRNPNKAKAHAIVARSMRAGNLVKEPCKKCGSEESIHAHHDDYSQPLNIQWLCPKHHHQWHAKNGEALNP